MNQIVHLCTQAAWLAAQETGAYRADSLESEGFIHCSSPEQVEAVANHFYRGQEGLVLLRIDPERVAAEIRWEDLYEAGEEFPHIYGPLETAAVVAVRGFNPGPDGYFSLGEEDKVDK